MRESSWYNVEVPKSQEKKTVNFSLKLPASLIDALAEIAEREDRPLGYVGRELMTRGLANYREDGRLRDEQTQHLAPVVATITPAQHKADEMRADEIRRQLNDGQGMPLATTSRRKIPIHNTEDIQRSQKTKRKA